VSDTQENLLLIGSLLLGIGLIAIGPFLGWAITRHEQKANRRVPQQRGIGETGEWLMTGEQRALMSKEPTRRLALVSGIKSPTQVMFASSAYVAMSTDLMDTYPSPTPGIPADPEITEEVPLQPREPEPQPEETEALAVALQQPTAGYSIIDAYVDDAELVLEEEPEISPAEIAFWRDPLASVVYPPEEIEELGIPMAATAFDTLKASGVLTGVGADLDVEWEAWNLYEREGASV
jgi:hypothetical protein